MKPPLATGKLTINLNDTPTEFQLSLFEENGDFVWHQESQDPRNLYLGPVQGSTLADAYQQAVSYGQFETSDFDVRFFQHYCKAEIPCQETNPSVHEERTVCLYLEPSDRTDLTSSKQLDDAEFQSLKKVYRWFFSPTRTELVRGVRAAHSVDEAKKLLAEAYPEARFL